MQDAGEGTKLTLSNSFNLIVDFEFDNFPKVVSAWKAYYSRSVPNLVAILR